MGEEKHSLERPASNVSEAKGDVEVLASSGSSEDVNALTVLGYKPELKRNRSMITLLFQSLAIAAIPYGEGAPLISAIYGGGQLSIFVGWIGRCLILPERPTLNGHADELQSC
jgi:hypothetical protein